MTENTNIVAMMDLPADVTSKVKDIVIVAQGLAVWDDEQYAQASDFAASCKAAINVIEKRRVEAKRPYKEACDAIDAYAKELKAPFTEAMEIARTAAYEYKIEQERKAEAARLKALEEAAAERARLEALAAAEEAKVVQAETHEERLAQEAKVIAIQNQAQAVSAVTPIAPVVKSTAGVSAKKKLRPNVVDMVAFIKWCAANVDANPAVATFLKVEQGKLNTFVNSTMGAVKMDGVSIEQVTSLVTRAKKL